MLLTILLLLGVVSVFALVVLRLPSGTGRRWLGMVIRKDDLDSLACVERKCFLLLSALGWSFNISQRRACTSQWLPASPRLLFALGSMKTVVLYKCNHETRHEVICRAISSRCLTRHQR